jgi:uncharacterized membrane protein (DUF485 family)
MNQEIIDRVAKNPEFKELVQKRSSFAWKLAIVMLVVYYSFIMTIAFSPETLGASLSGGITTVGIPVGIVIILIAFVLTGIYTKRANTEFDEMTARIVEDARSAK